MASITQRTKKDGSTVYLVQIRIPGTKSVSKSFPSHQEAQQFALHEEVEVRKMALRFNAPDPAKFYKERLRDVLDLFAAQEKTPQRTVNNIPSVKRLIPADTRIGELRPSWVEDFVERTLKTHSTRGVPYSPQSVAVHINILRQAYIWRARRYDIEPKNVPFVQGYLPRGWDEGRDRRLLPHEEKILFDAINKRVDRVYWNSLVVLALETAARLQEMILATWSEFNLKEGYWIIPKAHEKNRRDRPVPLSDAALKALAAMQVVNPGGPDDRVFSFLPSAASASAAFAKLKRKAGLVDFRFHDLRHEGISRFVLYRPEYSLMEIMKIVGHSSPYMVARYANLKAGELAKKMKRD